MSRVNKLMYLSALILLHIVRRFPVAGRKDKCSALLSIKAELLI